MNKNLRKILVGILFLTFSCTGLAEEEKTTKITAGAVYSCVVDGVRYYRSQPLEGAECKAINYSYLESMQLDPSWISIAQEDGMAMYYREKGIVRKGSIVTFWTMIDHELEQSMTDVGNIKYRSSIGRWSADCSELTYEAIQTTYYGDRLAKGKVVHQWLPSAKSQAPIYATPGSVGEIMIETVCKASKPAQRSTKGGA